MGRLEKSEVWSRGKSEASVSNEIEYLSGGSGKTTGLVEKLTVNGRSYTAEYDGNGNIVRLTDSLLGTTEYEYDALNQLTKVKQPDGTEHTCLFPSVSHHGASYKKCPGFWKYLLTNRFVPLIINNVAA